MHCATKMGYCMADTGCRATLTCINECQLFQPRSKQAMCAYICEMTDGKFSKNILSKIEIPLKMSMFFCILCTIYRSFTGKNMNFLTFPACFLIPIIFLI